MDSKVTQLLRNGCDALGLSVGEEKILAMLLHVEVLAKWNRTHNLTAITRPEDMVVQHILDSLAMQPYIQGQRMLDVGTGGGFPGLPLAILQPNLEVTLLDSRGKRVQFLRHVIGRLGMKNVSLENCRVENYRPEEKFDTLTARAFTSLANMVTLCQPCLETGTRLVALKGAKPDDEIEQLRQEVEGCENINIQIVKLQVPYLSAERHLVIIDF
jgi:16S rRNA (guanine527-N7)-methyltransferase